MNATRLLALGLVAVAATACTTTASRGTVTSYFNNKGQLEIIASSYREDWALQLAVNRGNATCKESGKAFAVITRQTQYQGVNQELKAALNVANYVSSGKVPYARSSSNDWQTTLLGECRSL